MKREKKERDIGEERDSVKWTIAIDDEGRRWKEESEKITKCNLNQKPHGPIV